MDLSAIASWPTQVRSKADFVVLVSAAYKLWRESWKLDVGFLLGLRRADEPARDFDALVYQLRTAELHDDNSDAIARWDEWTSNACDGHAPATEEDWAACGLALMVVLNAAIRCLCRLAADGRRQESFRRAWQEKIGESLVAVVTRVAADLGMYLRTAQRDRHVREVEYHWSRYRLRRGEAAADVLASFAERSLVSRMEALPCDYQLILDELRVLGTTNAVAALHLAHAVAEISRTSGEVYLKLVGATWASLQPDARR